MPRVALGDSSPAVTALVTDAARTLGVQVAQRPRAGHCAEAADLFLVDATPPEASTQAAAQRPEGPYFSLVDPANLDRVQQILQRGGIGLVRTTSMVGDLDHALRLVAAFSDAPARAVRLQPALVRAEFCHRLPNDVSQAYLWAAELRRELQERLTCPLILASRLAAAAFEAVQNAILRGNLEVSAGLQSAGDAATVSALAAMRRRQSPFRERAVWASCRLSAEEIRIVIRDEGQGFAAGPTWPQGVPVPALGRGGLILRAFCDQVRYNSEGNEVTILQSFPAISDEAALWPEIAAVQVPSPRQ
uniref:Histidine kinase/HSP90-like ATPase domain-containing protein n=1 Tax=Schlesneria paludicola TaxID=360056 RepID=A0A7C2NWK2_9PLAN